MKYTLKECKGYYYVDFYTKKVNGDYTRHTKATGVKTTKGNRHKADERARDIISQYEGLTAYGDESETLSSYIKKWLELNRNRLQVTTYDGYVCMYNKHIKPYFESYKLLLREVKPRHIEQYCNDKQYNEKLSPNTVIKHYALIGTVLKDAYKNRLIKENVAEFVTKPKKVKPENNFYTAEELKQLLNVAKGTKLEMPIYLAVFFGLRRSEALGLKWCAIDFNKRQLKICNKIIRSTADNKTTAIESATLKTDSSNRTFVFCDEQSQPHYEYLLALKKRHAMLSDVINKKIEYVCVDELGEVLKPDYITGAFEKLLKNNGMRHITFHDLRHSCISILANSTLCTPKQMQLYAGHADINTTMNRYSHTSADVTNTELNIITDTLNFNGKIE